MPRPKKDDPRDCNLTIRFSIAERRHLQARARASGSSVAVYARRRLFEGAAQGVTARAPQATPPRMNEAVAAELAEQLRRVGVNLNQIARRMNDFKQVQPRDLETTLDEVRRCLRQVKPPAP